MRRGWVRWVLASAIVAGIGTTRLGAQEIIEPHSKTAVYRYGRSVYVPPQISAAPPTNFGVAGYGMFNYPGIASPYGFGMQGWGWGGLNPRMPWGPIYEGGMAPINEVPNSL